MTTVRVAVVSLSAPIAGPPSVVDGVRPEFRDLTLAVTNPRSASLFICDAPQHLHFDADTATLSVYFHRQAIAAPAPGVLGPHGLVPNRKIDPGATATVTARLPAQLMLAGAGQGLSHGWRAQSILDFRHLTIEIEVADSSAGVARRFRDEPLAEASPAPGAPQRVIIHVSRGAIPEAPANATEQPS